MSTRILTLFTTTAATAALALAGGITAAAAAPAPPPAPAGAETVPSAAAPQSDTASSKGDAALKECRDADCTVEITDGQQITLDKKFGVAPIKVNVEGTRVRFAFRDHMSQGIAIVDAQHAHSTATFNGITLHPYVAKDGKVMVTVSHR
ncbi:hypothetical protein [Spirillospora sp. NPDC048819]|uniref:hypothetical protein n=1 Tax=Spirillospora sp. NPDC048819 TaxID=3155268 RepID=UPI0033E234FE